MDAERRGFETTDWNLVGNIRQGDDDARREALGRLLQLYLPALKAHLIVGRRLPSHQADDLLQEFVRCKILERDLIGRADPNRGKFRSFLLTALDNFVRSERRKERTQKRAADYGASLDSAEEGGDVRASRSPADVFDTTWAVGVVAESLRRTMTACANEQRPQIWGVFACRTLSLLEGSPPLPYEQVVPRFGFDSERQAANALTSAQRKFRGLLRATIAEYAGAEEVDQELLDLQQILRQAGAEVVEQLRLGLWFSVPEVSVASCVSAQTNPLLLIRLLQFGSPGRRQREAGELAVLWKDLLASPVQFDLNDLEAVDTSLARFGDLFHRPNPPLELLERTRQLGKKYREDPDSPLPEALATMLYYASIVAARVRHGQRISSLDDARLGKGIRWALDQPWLEESTRSLFQQGVRVLES